MISSGIKIGERIKVYIERDDGAILETPGIIVSMELGSDSGDISTRFRMETVGLGMPVWSSPGDWRSSLNKRHTAAEWLCDFCGRPNQRADETCKSCGAVRSFVYG